MTSNSEESLFPPGWWKKSPEDYAEARAALKSLAQKDLEGGTKDVSFLCICITYFVYYHHHLKEFLFKKL